METHPVILKARRHYGSPLFGYVLALALVAVSGVGRLALMSSGHSRAPFLLFYPAIAAAAFLGGVGPGLLAVCSGAIFATFFFPPPQPGSWIALAVIGPLFVSGFAHLREMREQNRASALDCQRFRFISDHASDWLLLASPTGQIEFANQIAAAQLALDPAKQPDKRLDECVEPAQRAAFREMLTTCEHQEVAAGEFSFEVADGSLAVVEVKCTGVKTKGSVVLHVVARDVTERRQMEARLREAQKWESLGVMAGGLAHDFNNLLTSILGNASLAREFLSEAPGVAPEVAGPLREIERAGERSADLVRLMLAAAGHRSRNADVSAAGPILERTLASLSIPAHIRVAAEVEPGIPPATPLAMSTLFGTTVLGSLIENAIESYGQNPGEVQVRICGGTTPGPDRVSFEEGLVQGPCVGIIVEDQGCGMSKEVLQRAFDPFFSTKFTGRGLGLPAVRGLVRAHSGKLRIHTLPGTGTRAEVWIPQADLGLSK